MHHIKPGTFYNINHRILSQLHRNGQLIRNNQKQPLKNITQTTNFELHRGAEFRVNGFQLRSELFLVRLDCEAVLPAQLLPYQDLSHDAKV